MEQERVELSKVKRRYETILSRKHIGIFRAVLIIEYLERISGKDFKNTKDFKEKMNTFIEKFDYKGNDLRKARNHLELERSELAKLFNVSNHSIKQMEQNKKPLSKGAVNLIKDVGHEKLLTLKKAIKSVSEPNCMDMPKIDKIPPEKMLEICKVCDLIRCDFCKKQNEDYEMTIDTPGKFNSNLICEDCLENKREEKTSRGPHECHQAE